MITVAILINGHPLMARSAFNTGETKEGVTVYQTDCGKKILHHRDEGAVKLAHMLLDCIIEAEPTDE